MPFNFKQKEVTELDERTLHIIKPHTFYDHSDNTFGVMADIQSGCTRAGLKLIAVKVCWMNKIDVETFYKAHIGKPYFEDLINEMTSGPLVAMVWEGKNAILALRQLNGATDPKMASEGTFRNKYGSRLVVAKNAVHASDSKESAPIEIKYFFPGL